MTVAANALKGALLYAQLHSGPAGTNGTANIATSTRKAITWGAVSAGSFGITSSLSFTGGTPNGPAYSVTLWSAATSGTFYGELITSGSSTLDGSGNYVLSALDFAGGNVNPSAAPPAAVTYDATGAGSKGLANTWTWSHTIGADANALVVMLSALSNPVPTVAAKCGAVDMVLLGERTAYYFDGVNYASVHVFGLLNPPTGTRTITTTALPWGSQGGANSVSYKNVTSFSNAVTNMGTTEAPTITVPTKPGGLIVGGFSGRAATFTGLTGTSRFSSAYGGGSNLAFMYQDNPANDRKPEATLSAAAGAVNWGAVGVPLNP